jgi:hypothetical protein
MRFAACGLVRVVFALGVVLAVCAGETSWAAERRVALVVGNARYPASPLNNPENDARVVAVTLRKLGFEVIEHVNLPVKDFRRVLREFAKRLQNEEGTSVFYYAGHGVQIAGRNYLLPVDVNLRDEDEVRDESVDVDELFVSRLERARTQVRIVILDACRDNPFGPRNRGLRGVTNGLAEMAARGALIAYSSAPYATAEDGPPGTNSVYTRHLVKEMLAEGIEVEQMFKNVRVKVLRDTNDRQVPWVNTSLTANFSFNPKRGVAGEDVVKREEITRLQALLDQRDRELQRERELNRQRATADAGRVVASGRKEEPVPAPRAGAASPPRTEAPKLVGTRASTPSGRAGGSEQPKAPVATGDTGVAMSPVDKPSATEPRVKARAQAGAPSERCVALLVRAQLGEPVGPSDMSYLQKECR